MISGPVTSLASHFKNYHIFFSQPQPLTNKKILAKHNFTTEIRTFITLCNAISSLSDPCLCMFYSIVLGMCTVAIYHLTVAYTKNYMQSNNTEDIVFK